MTILLRLLLPVADPRGTSGVCSELSVDSPAQFRAQGIALKTPLPVASGGSDRSSISAAGP